MKIVGTLLVRDGEEIVQEWIEHHLSAGIDEIIVTDNFSEDGTKSILSKYKEVVRIIDEPGRNHAQDIWVTRMAKEGCCLGADWLVHMDCDEFWTGFEHLAAVPEDVSIVLTDNWYNHIPNPALSYGDFTRSKMPAYTIGSGWASNHKSSEINNRLYSLSRKIIHRPNPNIQIWCGNHFASNYTGKVMIEDRIKIHHYPIRSFEQFKHKIIIGGEAMLRSNSPETTNAHWRKWYKFYQEDRLQEIYRTIVEESNHLPNSLIKLM